MASLEDRRYSISEVAEIAGVPDYVLRQWEKRYSRLKPKRTRAGHRYYELADIEIVRRIKHRLWHKGMTGDGVEQSLIEDLRMPQNAREAVELINQMESEIEAMLALLTAPAPKTAPARPAIHRLR